MAKKSGYDKYDGIWGNPYYDDEFNDIINFDFSQKTYRSSPALVALKVKDGWIEVQEYTGQPFDPSEYRLKPAKWDHDHCCVCQYAISDGNTYWENKSRKYLCDACYGHYIRDKQVSCPDRKASST